AELLGHELGEDRLRPLPHLGRTGEDPDAAIRAELERGDARQLDLATPREPGTVPGEGDADPRRRAVTARPERRARHAAGPLPPRAGPLGPGAAALELGGLGGPLQHVRGGHALAEDLARRRLVAEPVEVPPADLQRADPERFRDATELDLGRELD